MKIETEKKLCRRRLEGEAVLYDTVNELAYNEIFWRSWKGGRPRNAMVRRPREFHSLENNAWLDGPSSTHDHTRHQKKVSSRSDLQQMYPPYVNTTAPPPATSSFEIYIDHSWYSSTDVRHHQ